MLSPQQILSSFDETSIEWWALVYLWYAYWAVFLLMVVTGFTLMVFKKPRPSMRVFGVFLATPLLLISSLALLTGNLSLGVIFTLLSMALAVVAIKLSKRTVEVTSIGAALPGLLISLFALFYFYFLGTESLVPYLSVGLSLHVTLSMAIGFSLIFGFTDSLKWSMFLGIAGAVYGLYGTANLPQAIDWVLLVGAALIIIFAFIQKPYTTSRTA